MNSDQLTPQNAKMIAGYAPEDTPMPPRRSAYTNDFAGSLAYGTACGRWVAYQALMGVTVKVDD